MDLSRYLHDKGFRVEARAVAGFAQGLHIGQEAHLHPGHALALAGLAAAALGVEGEAPGAPAVDARILGLGVELADIVPEADVGGRAGARGLADGGLVHLQHPQDRLPAVQLVAAVVVVVGHAALLVAATEQVLQALDHHIAHQGRFAGAGDTADADQALQREGDVELFEVVEMRRPGCAGTPSRPSPAEWGGEICWARFRRSCASLRPRH